MGISSRDDLPVSVVIPCYRCRGTIDRALVSICSQTKRPAEILLIDDASNDGTLEKLWELQASHPEGWIKVHSFNENRGPGAARNSGWKLAQQPFIAFLDADDSWHSRKIEIQYKYMIGNNAVMSGHSTDIKISNEISYLSCDGLDFNNINPAVLLFKNLYSTSSVMLRRDIPLRFDEKQRFAEDYRLWTEIAFSGLAVAYSKERLAFQHKHPFLVSGLSSRILDMELGELNVFRKLHNARRISTTQMLTSYIWSIMRYLRRAVISGRFR